MKRSGFADLPLHYGTIPRWLSERMSRLGGAIIEAIVHEYGKDEVLRRMSDPFWFQALGCVMGMDWHSSGITTSIMGALKSAVNRRSGELGIYICGGRGRHSRKTPEELLHIANKTGSDGNHLVRSSRLTAKVENNAIQDGFQIYLHSFIVTDEGKWTVVQQGLNDNTGLARRYHWHSPDIKSFVEEPHSSIYGKNSGRIINLVHHEAGDSRSSIVSMSQEQPDCMLTEIRKLSMAKHHNVRVHNLDLKRLGAVLAVAYEENINDFESLLLVRGLGPRTLQSMALVSEVIYGTPSRFTDPARFSFAHGGKDGHPGPVLTKVYDETVEYLKNALSMAKLGHTDKNTAFKNLSQAVEFIEYSYDPRAHLDKLIDKEYREAMQYGGRTVFDRKQKANKRDKEVDVQLTMF